MQPDIKKNSVRHKEKYNALNLLCRVSYFFALSTADVIKAVAVQLSQWVKFIKLASDLMVSFMRLYGL